MLSDPRLRQVALDVILNKQRLELERKQDVSKLRRQLHLDAAFGAEVGDTDV